MNIRSVSVYKVSNIATTINIKNAVTILWSKMYLSLNTLAIK